MGSEYSYPQVAAAQQFEVDSLQWLGEPGATNSPSALSNIVGDVPNRLSVALSTRYTNTPLVEETPNGHEVLIEDLMSTQIRLSGSPIDRLQLDLAVPVFTMSRTPSARYNGLGDLRLAIGGTIINSTKRGPGFGLNLLSWIPTGDAARGFGSRYASMGIIASAQHSVGPLHIAANAGARVGPTESLRNVRSGSGPLMGLSVGVVPIDDWGLHVQWVSHGSHGWTQLPSELIGNTTWRFSRHLWLSASSGVGLNNVLGSPAWRAGVNMGWRWAAKQVEPVPTPLLVRVPEPSRTADVQKTRSTREPDRQDGLLAELTDERIVLHDRIYFEEGSAILLKQSDGILFAVLDILANHLEIQHLLIEGHTNHRGKFSANLALSERRAQAVMNWLVAHGVNPHRIVCKGYGSHRPIVPPSHEDAIEINRRVEFTILRPDRETD